VPDAGSSTRPFADGRFSHPDGRARFLAVRPRRPAHTTDAEYPLVLNTGRSRDQWHTMTRSGRSARLAAHMPEPYVDLHPQDALLGGVREGELVRVATRWGSMVARLRHCDELPRRMAFVPIHWSAPHASDGRVGGLVNPVVDPISGEPEFKHTPARVAPFVVSWQGFALSRRELSITDAVWWARAQADGFVRYEFAGRRSHGNWSSWARRVLQARHEDDDWLEYFDAGTRVYRAAHFVDQRLESCLFLSPRPDLPSRSWLAALFAQPAIGVADRAAILAGRPPGPSCDSGPTVCSCFGVGRNTVRTAARQHALRTVQDVGRKLRAGTNCGSCVPELQRLLDQALGAE
jgi:assimilatory nitrate reductase catalytic subunit